MSYPKRKIFLLISCLLILNLSSPLCFVESKNTPKILTILGLGFGESYFMNRDIMVSYGWEIVVSGTTTNLISCINKDLPNEESDVLIQDLEVSDLENYDCIFVPSGGHWSNLISSQIVLDLIQDAHELGILVAGICTGMIVLALSDILEDVEVAFNVQASEWLSHAGAIMTSASVVSDERIITGGFGGGISSGAEGAPNEEFCETISTELEFDNNNLLAIILPSVIGGLLVISIIIVIIITKGRIWSLFKKTKV